MQFSVTRLLALTKKETKQIMRDPSNALIAVVIPLLLLFIFGYGINLDANKIRLGVIIEQPSQPANQFLQTLQGSPFIEPVLAQQRQQLQPLLEGGKIRGMVILPVNFAQQFALNQAKIQVITDGSEPNIANFVQAYLQGIWQIWLLEQQQDQAVTLKQPMQVESRFWFNAPAISQHFILPGAITIIMTVIGSILTALVIAREWERGTMESLLSTPMSRLEFILSKLLPYYVLGLIALVICWCVSCFILGVPYRGSLLLLFLIGSLFLFTVLGMGLLISTVMNNQFNAAMVALNAAFLPAVMLSGFVFEIDSMPLIVKLTTYLIPARYFVSILQTLFLAGNVSMLLLINSAMLIGFILLLFAVTLHKTKLRLD